MHYRPCDELLDVLAPAFWPCEMFDRACCGSATRDPTRGHVPRGFIGALGSLQAVEVVIIVAEPGDPLEGRRHVVKGNPVLEIETVCEEAYRVLDNPAGRGRQFHRNVRQLLDLIYPGMPLPDQLRRVWITESVLCSACKESGPITRACERACVDRYLARQLALLPGRPHVPFGNKSRDRAGLRGLLMAHPSSWPCLSARCPPSVARRGGWVDSRRRARVMPTSLDIADGKVQGIGGSRLYDFPNRQRVLPAHDQLIDLRHLPTTAAGLQGPG